MLLPWQRWLRPGDGLLFSCRSDQAIWRRLVKRSALWEWVVPLAVDETLFQPCSAEERRTARARLGVPAEAPLLLYVGRLNIQKNLHTLLYLLRAVREQVPETRLWLVGEEDDIVLGEFGVSNAGYVAYLRRLADASPPMFRGRDYALYETLMEPYATRLAHTVPLEAIRPDHAPYHAVPIECDPDRRLARSQDPVWAHHAFLSPMAWVVLQFVDGSTDVSGIVEALTVGDSGIRSTEITAALWRLHVGGFVLFSR